MMFAYFATPTHYGRPMKPFSLKSRIFGLGQTNWADKFWGICGIFGQIKNEKREAQRKSKKLGT